MIYIIKPARQYQDNQRAWNKLYRRLLSGSLPPNHHECVGVEIFSNDLHKAMNDIYKPKFSKGDLVVHVFTERKQ